MPRSAFRLRSRAVSLLITGLPLLLAACNDRPQTPATASVPPPVPVLVETVSTTPVADVVELPGRIEAVRTAEIRARVDGIVERTLYQEGTDLPANAPLFQIDASDYRAQLQQAQAALTRATAVRDNAASVVERFKPLVGRHAVSAQEYDAALATMQQAQANVSDAQAAVSLAQLRLDRCIIRTPIAGRAGRALVTEGALVSAGAATLLTQVNQLTPINAVFTQSNTVMLDVEQQIQSGARKPISMKHVEVQLILANGQVYNERGFLDFADLVIDPSTGTQTVPRALRESGPHAVAGAIRARAHHRGGHAAGHPYSRARGATRQRRCERRAGRRRRHRGPPQHRSRRTGRRTLDRA
ncbi:efflux RND transporter periplasmic adaptor subunit [Paraburkholderia atlantica]|uniref:efflux RND transporter periplasmic adaptor subunit n=1 Tax=Paraburkholderia atlantica TaxID=2654982 RepID=UPI003D1A94A0